MQMGQIIFAIMFNPIMPPLPTYIMWVVTKLSACTCTYRHTWSSLCAPHPPPGSNFNTYLGPMYGGDTLQKRMYVQYSVCIRPKRRKEEKRTHPFNIKECRGGDDVSMHKVFATFFFFPGGGLGGGGNWLL